LGRARLDPEKRNKRSKIKCMDLWGEKQFGGGGERGNSLRKYLRG